MAWRASSVSTYGGGSCTIPNWRTTRSGVCFSTIQKHTSGTLAVHTSLPATQNAGRWANSASYGCHTTWNSQIKGQHIMQCSISMSSFTFINTIVINNRINTMLVPALDAYNLKADGTGPDRFRWGYSRCSQPTQSYNCERGSQYLELRIWSNQQQ